MKTKTWINWSLYFLAPVFLMCITFAVISTEYFLGVNSKGIIATFVTNDIVSSILAGLMWVNVVGIAVIMVTFLELSKKADKIDNLDEAAEALYEARQKYEAATQRLVQMQPLEEAKDLDRRMFAENIKEFVDNEYDEKRINELFKKRKDIQENFKY